MRASIVYKLRITNYEMSVVYLGIGSNLGDRRRNIDGVIALLSERVGEVRALSGFYETQPWGYDSEELFLNVTVEVETGMSPAELLVVTQTIERDAGRQIKTVNAEYHDRTIDIDILLFDDLIINTPELTIPHPLMHLRAFVLHPLTEIAPHAVHPVLRKSIEELSMFRNS